MSLLFCVWANQEEEEDKSDKEDNSDKDEKSEKEEKSDKEDKTDEEDNSDQKAKSDQEEKSDQENKDDQEDKSDKKDKSDKDDKSDQDDESDQDDKSDQGDKSDKDDESDQDDGQKEVSAKSDKGCLDQDSAGHSSADNEAAEHAGSLVDRSTSFGGSETSPAEVRSARPRIGPRSRVQRQADDENATGEEDRADTTVLKIPEKYRRLSDAGLLEAVSVGLMQTHPAVKPSQQLIRPENQEYLSPAAQLLDAEAVLSRPRIGLKSRFQVPAGEISEQKPHLVNNLGLLQEDSTVGQGTEPAVEQLQLDYKQLQGVVLASAEAAPARPRPRIGPKSKVRKIEDEEQAVVVQAASQVLEGMSNSNAPSYYGTQLMYLP